MDKKIKVTVTIEVDEQWASNQGREALIDYLKNKLNSTLGFRGQVKRFRIVGR